ncbi:hypothetical protein B0T14DRAFT_602656 [Immersiella caudata]|uniref:Uncharacterized protein n=1 Tax=Immersiella caudata TaxID=314043 RepID=A0AA40C3R2_9PEZI|nr:hypothetical protein B0T14DRAFT_602656 [Immersiella caudata]
MKLTRVIFAPLASLATAASWYGVRDVAWIAKDRVTGPVFAALNNLNGEIQGLPNSAAKGACQTFFQQGVANLQNAITFLDQIANQAQGVINAGGARLAAPDGPTHSVEPLCPAFEGL